MVAPMPRVQVPSAATKGEIFQVKAIISHQMETGLRKDHEGNVIPRLIINKFVCRYNGVDVFSSICTRPLPPTRISSSACARPRAAGSSSFGKRTAAGFTRWRTSSL